MAVVVPLRMRTQGCSVTATGLAIVLLSAGTGIALGGSGGSVIGFGLLLSSTGLVAGVNLIALGVSMTSDGTADSAATMFSPRISAALAAAFPLPRRRGSVAVAFMGLLMASFAVTAVAGDDAGPVLCLGMLALLLLASL